MMDKDMACLVLRYVDEFAGQENDAEEVRDFIQCAARFWEEGKSWDEWKEEPLLTEFIEWVGLGYHPGDHP